MLIYIAALAKGDNEVVQPQSTNIESFPVVENDLDRANSPGKHIRKKFEKRRVGSH
jgi:hypothetical protein